MRVISDAADMEAYRFDETAYMRAGTPLAVCFPRSTADVQALVALCAREHVPIVPRGAGTGLSGGAVALDGALTVSFTEMNRILEIDPENLTVTTQPGIINAELNRAVADHGLFYPPDPASFEMCTIGGNLAENSGGLRCVKYGVTVDWVLGLEVVLADGSVIRTGGKNVKDVAGYDLTGLFVGSEGTLGLITEATLRLLPLPPPKLTLIAFFDTVTAAGEAVSGMTAAGIVPVTLELLDAYTIAAVDDAFQLGPGSLRRRDADGRVGPGRRRRADGAGHGRGRHAWPRAPHRSFAPPTPRRRTGCARRGGRRTGRSRSVARRGWTTSECRAAGSPRCSPRSSASPLPTS